MQLENDFALYQKFTQDNTVTTNLRNHTSTPIATIRKQSAKR